MRFTDIFIKRPVLASVVSLLILLVGLRSLQLLNVREFPEMRNAVVIVSTAYPGASPALIQGFITTPLEQEIATADGIDYLESSSLLGVSTITAHLMINYDPNDALADINTKINAVRNELPAEAEDPSVQVDIGNTIDAMYLSFYSDVLKPNQITDYLTRVVQPKLSTVPGVQRAEILGARNFAMRVWLKPDRMTALGITPSDVSRVLAANNFLAGVGKTKGNAVSVNLTASTDVHSPEQFEQLVVKRQAGATIRLKDIANVELGAEDYETSVKFNGKAATYIGIKVEPTANVLDVIKDVRLAFSEIQADLPTGLKAYVAYDSTDYIHESIHEVLSTLGQAGLIVLLVIFLFLGSLRTALIPAVTVPLSLIGAAFLMLTLGFSINLLTLLAMVLAIGMVVDDAIIVAENIDRHIGEGLRPMEAALIGARELGGPVIAMTITLLAVYAPIGFLGGLTGSLFTEFAFTLAGAVLVSGLIALTLSPMMCAKLLKPHAGNRFTCFLDRQFDRLKHGYQRRLHGSLNYLPVTIVFAAAILISCYFLFATVQQELAPEEDQGVLFMQSEADPNASIDHLSRYTDEITHIVRRFPESEFQFLFNGVGGGGAAGTTNTAMSGMVLKPWGQRNRTQQQLQPLVQQQVGGVAALQTAVFALPSLPGASGFPVEFVIGSTQPPVAMNRVSQALLAKARGSGLFAFADTDLKYNKLQTEIEIDRDRAADLGLNMREVGSDMASMLGGNYINRFSIQGRSYKVVPQVRRRYRLNADQLEQYRVRARNGELVPLSSFVKLKEQVQPQQLKRFQQLNSAMISAVPLPGVTQGQALDYLKAQADQLLPQGYSVDYAGQSRQYVQESGGLTLTFFFAIIIIFLVLAAQFESFRDPLIILISVPLSICGALIFLSLGFATINIYTQVGLITLIGVISKHGILIVQFANQLQEREGLNKREAIENAAAIRLRPVLMTTVALVVAMVPLLLATGAGAASRFDIGLVIASGMSIGTLFTLFVVPAVYMLIARDHQHVPEAALTETEGLGAL